MKIFQVVFLVDLDSVSQDLTDEGTLNIEAKTLRLVLLKFLTFFATEHCASDSNASFSLKWDCKYYTSSVSKSIRQRCTFQDFNLVNYEKFENELEDQLKKYRLELQVGQHRQVTSLVEDCGTSKTFKKRVHNLELALKDLVCDYTWDQPYVCSPLRKTRRQQKDGENRRKSNESEPNRELENIVIVITGVPRLHTELDGLIEGKRRLTQSVLLDKILPPSLYKQFVQISKIRLFWLDASNVIQNELNSKIDSSETQAIFDLFHQALRKTGGGLIPLSAILPSQLESNEASTSCQKQIPEGLSFQIPFSALMSGYLLDERGNADKQSQIYHSSQLHMNHGTKESRPMVCDLELLPLFKSDISYSDLRSEKRSSFRIFGSNIVQEKRTSNLEVVELAKHFNVTCSNSTEETDQCYIPQNIRVIGTILLCEIHNQLIAKPLVYVCCPVYHQAAKNQSNENFLSVHRILMELTANQMALLVSCDDLCQGIFFPSNNRCEIALLYMLASEGEASLFNLKVGPVSVPQDIQFLIQKSLETCNNVSPQKKVKIVCSQQENATLSPTFLEKWFIPHPCHKNTLRDMKVSSTPSTCHMAQKKIFKRLQKAYLPSIMNVKVREFSSVSSDSIPFDKLRRSPRLKRVSQLNADGSVQKPVLHISTNSCHSLGEKPGIKKMSTILNNEPSTSAVVCDLTNETDMVASLQAIYKEGISGESSVLSIAHMVLDTCLSFYKNQARINVKMCTRDAISKHFLRKPSDVECLNGTKEVVKKWKTREHCFQSIIRLELLAIDPSKSEEYVSETTAHLRKLSFIAGPSTLSSFLQETIVENYYGQLKEAVAEICEDLNQPLPNEGNKLSSSSSNEGLLSPEKPNSIQTSMLSQMSMVSSISSCSNQSKSFKTKRSEAVTRFPSFGDVVHKRKIVISHANPKRHSLHMTSKNGPLTRSAQKRLQEKSTGSKSTSKNVCRTLFKHGIPTTRRHTTPSKPQKPTTPKGRHVLRTKNVADTPLHKQVEKPTLHRQSLKRKRTTEIDSPEKEVVEESPDKQPDQSYNSRQSPKTQATTLRREASFYSVCPESKTENAMTSEVAPSKTPLRRSTRKLVQSTCSKITPDRKFKAKRVLILSGTPEKMSKTTPKKALKVNSSPFSPRRSDRLSAIKSSPQHKRTRMQSASDCSPGTCDKLITKRTPTSSRRKSPKLSKSRLLDFDETTSNVTDPLSQTPLANRRAQGVLKKSRVSRKILQTPLKSGSKSTSDTSTTKYNMSGTFNEDRILSTPTRNGQESPEASPCHIFLYGPLAGNSDDCLSRSSSPIIPLLSNETTEFYEDQNLCVSFEAPFDTAVASKCDDVHACPDTDVNFRQYFSSHDVHMSPKCGLHDAVVPSEKLAQEDTNFMFTPDKTYATGTCSPECALPAWEIKNGFNGGFGLMEKHTLDTPGTAEKNTGSLELIQFSSAETINAFEESSSSVFVNVFDTRPSATGETKTSSSSDCYSLQRFTRQASKELGISLKKFKELTSEFGPFENGEEASQSPKKKANSASELSTAQHPKSSSSTKLCKPLAKPKFTPPTNKSVFHLTNSPILSSVSARTTRLRTRMDGTKDQLS